MFLIGPTNLSFLAFTTNISILSFRCRPTVGIKSLTHILSHLPFMARSTNVDASKSPAPKKRCIMHCKRCPDNPELKKCGCSKGKNNASSKVKAQSARAPLNAPQSPVPLSPDDISSTLGLGPSPNPEPHSTTPSQPVDKFTVIAQRFAAPALKTPPVRWVIERARIVR